MTIVLIVALFSLLILVHEYGHFIAARKSGVFVEEFGFGFPPRVLGVWKDRKKRKWRVMLFKRGRLNGKERDGTVFSINLIPFGGFVKMKGEDGAAKNQKDSFAAQSLGKRFIIIVAGVAMNVVFAFVMFAVLHNIGVPTVVDAGQDSSAVITNKQVVIMEVVEGTPAEKAGLEVGDVILQIESGAESVEAADAEALSSFIRTHRGDKLKLDIKRGDEKLEVTAFPRTEFLPEEGALGIAMLTVGEIRYPWYRAIWEGLKTTASMTALIVSSFFGILKDLVVQGKVTQDLAGPVGIAVISAQIAKLGFKHLLQFGALISINLAVINIFPFPALDGGRLIFLIIEAFRGRPVQPRVEQLIHGVGFVLLLALIFLVTVRDVGRFF